MLDNNRSRLLFFGVILAAGLYIFVLGLGICLSDHPSFRGSEYNVLYSVVKLTRGLPLYTNPTLAPFDMQQYSPLFPLTAAAFAKALGIPSSQIAQLSFISRFVSFLAAIGIFWILIKMIPRFFSAGRIEAAAGASIAMIACCPWLFLCRPDSLALFFSLVCYATMIYYLSLDLDKTPSRVFCVIAMGFAGTLAFLTKQDFAVTLVVVGLYLLLLKQWKHFIILCLVFLIVLPAFHGVFQSAIGDWESIRLNTLEGIKNNVWPFDILWRRTYSPFFLGYLPILAVSVYYSIRYFPRSARDRASPAAFIAFALAALLVADVLRGLKAGSAVNYFNDFLMLSAIPIGVLFTNRKEIHKPATLIVALAAFAVFSLCVTHSHAVLYGGVIRTARHYYSFSEIAAYLTQKFEGQQPRRYFYAADSPLALFLPDYAAAPQPDVLRVSGGIDFSKFYEGFKNGEIRMLVMHEYNKDYDGLIPQAADNYKFIKNIGEYRIYSCDPADIPVIRNLFSLTTSTASLVTGTVKPSELESGAFSIDARNNDPYLVLPPSEIEGPGAFRVTLKIEVPADTLLMIFWKEQKNQNFRMEDIVRTRLKKGENSLFIDFKTRNSLYQVRIDPGAVSGKYIIQKLDVDRILDEK